MSISAESTEAISKIDAQKDVCSANDFTKIKTPPVRRNPFLGFFYLLLASVMFTFVSVIVKKLSYIDSSQLSFALNAGNLVFSLPIVVYYVKDVIGAKKDRKLLVMRGFLGGTALYLYLMSYTYLPMAEAAVVMSTLPATTTLAACIFLKEHCGGIQIVSLVITICGVLTSVRLPELLGDTGPSRFDFYYVAGLAAGIGCVTTFSITIVTLRKMKCVHFSVPMLYYGFFGTVEIGVINAATSSVVYPKCGWDQFLYFMIPVLGFLANCAFTLSTQVEAAGIVSVVKASMDIIVAIVFQILFFNTSPDAYNIVGASLVILAVSLLGIRNWLLILPEESRTRKRLKYFLT